MSNFIRRLVGKMKAISTGTNAIVSKKDSIYANWSKEQLIRRITELENANKPHSEKFQHIEDNKKRKISQEEVTRSKAKKAPKKFDFSKHNTRFIALRFAYLGWNYNGLAVQKEFTPLPTVEGTILEAMNKCKLVPSMVLQDYKFSRCGRTDKGVSAMNQVISLEVRSNLTDEEQRDPTNDSREIPYVHVLNQLLPDDIRISAVCLRPPPNFDARFSCVHRHYKYIFNGKNLNIEKMSKAASYFVGERDFRNFCKLDGSKQITNFKRTIISSIILPLSETFYCFDLIGSAFLWHQVRCMMAILFLVGQSLEVPEIVLRLTDIEKTPQRPVYEMANDIPLLLYDCKFPEMDWQEPTVDDYKAIKFTTATEALTLHYELKAAVCNIFKDVLPTANTNNFSKTIINLGDGRGKVVGSYVKLEDRSVMEPVEVVNAKYSKKKNNKNK
ncbi:Deg1p [Saccharomyces cerevisiae YJM1332]|nr:Deg1p [Saccharomyces cerevisiae YJM1332]